jgi:hypothetical protein
MVVDWPQERVVVTGGAGFLGNHVVEGLRERGCKQIVCPRSREYDLVQMDAVERLYRDARPSLVLHLAARVGGIGVKARGAAQVKKPSARVLSYDVIRSRRATADIRHRAGLAGGGASAWRERLPPITPASTKCSIAPTISSGAVTVTDGTVTQTSTVSASTKILARPPLAMPTNRRTSRRRGRRWRFVLTYFTPYSVLP